MKLRAVPFSLIVFIASIFAVILLAGCGKSVQSPLGLRVTSFASLGIQSAQLFQHSIAALPLYSVEDLRSELAAPPDFGGGVPNFSSGWINSGAPDYLKVNLIKLELQGDWGNNFTLWEGSKELLLTGTDVDISDLTCSLRKPPVGKVTSVSATFDSAAKIKGTLSRLYFNIGEQPGPGVEKTFHTKANFAYNPILGTGGAAGTNPYSNFESDNAEETVVYLDSYADTFTVRQACDVVLGPSSSPSSNVTLTMVFDLNRILRFYTGMGSGVTQGESAGSAYFFAHSLLGTFVGLFFGDIGSIEAYEARYSSARSEGDPDGVSGWMTLIFDSNGNFLSGMLSADDDNAPAVAKGRVTSFTPRGNGLTDFTYDISQGVVTGFVRPSTAGSYSPVASFVTTSSLSAHSGEVYFMLR